MNKQIQLQWSKNRPDSGGWWLWSEGDGSSFERLLLTSCGQEVEDDDAYEQVTGVNVDEYEADTGAQLNYWSCTATTQKMMPGLWAKDPDQSVMSN